MATIELTRANFDETIRNNEIVLIDYWATWCGPCKMFEPIFEEMSEKYPDMVFGKVNTEEEQELAGMFQISSIPTLMIFRDQIVIFSQPGMLPSSALEEIITKAKSLDMDEVRARLDKEEAEEQQKS